VEEEEEEEENRKSLLLQVVVCRSSHTKGVVGCHVMSTSVVHIRLP
jgi:hypothetical protein